MASYGSKYGIKNMETHHFSHGDGSDGSRRDPTENTPLLLSSPREFSLASPSLRSTRDIEDGLITINDILDEHAALPLLSRLGTTPVGVEAEAIPATNSTPDECGDFRLPRDETLRYSAHADVSEDATEVDFHGGITRSQFWLIFTGILCANFIAAFDSTIMASTHTSVTSDFHASELASWLSTSFLLTSTSFQPLYGRVSDVVGRRPPFVFSCLIFTSATLWCAMAPDIFGFIAARALCGIGAGGMMTMGAIVLSDILPIEIRGTYQSINNLAWGSGGVLGAASGGALADLVGWRWSFGLQVPFGIFCMTVLYLTIPARDTSGSTSALWERFRDFDFKGSFYLTTSLSFLILGMNLGGNIFEWTDSRVVGSLVIGIILGYLLLWVEMEALSPVMPLRLLHSGRGMVVFNNFFNTAAINAVIFNLPLYFQGVRLETATQAGGRLLVPSLTSTCSGVATGLIITRLQRLDFTLYLGTVLVLIGALGLVLMPDGLPSWCYFLFLIPCHLGSGFVMPSALMGTLTMSTQVDQAVATSTLIMWRSLGGVMGVASSSLIVQNFLALFLERNVTGPEKEWIIHMVRQRVQSIFELEPELQRQVTGSYEEALKVCFIYVFVIATMAALLAFNVRLPRLHGKQGKDKYGEAVCHVVE